MIFGLAIAGEPTAAALIISAKGLLRYPELGTAARRQNDDPTSKAEPTLEDLTEYLLVGSLVSWAIALVPLLVLPT